MTATTDFRCPNCRGGLHVAPGAYACTPCGLTYPILHGIPDFRLRSDKYLTLAEERAKAARLHEFGRTHSFDELVDFYYSITDDVPPELAPVYAGYVRQGPSRAAAILRDLGALGPDARVLDLGCGSAGMNVAAGREGPAVVGVDIALRWLVIGAKRLEEMGLPADLVCADAEALPFAPGAFSHVVAADLLENAYSPDDVVASMAVQLRPGGVAWLCASNRWWPGPHPSVGVWAVGYIPQPLRSAVVKALRGVDSLRNVTLVSAWGVAAACRRHGLIPARREPRAIDPGQMAGRGGAARLAAGIYARLCNVFGVRQLLFALGPAFQMTARKI